MGRRKLQWKQQFVRAGNDVDKIIPRPASGRGEYLTSTDTEGKKKVSPGTGKGKIVTKPILARKEALVRKWAK